MLLTILLILIGPIVLYFFVDLVFTLIFSDPSPGSKECGIGAILISLALLLTTPVSFYRTAYVWTVGGEWSSHFTLHLPTATDVLVNYIPVLLKDWNTMAFLGAPWFLWGAVLLGAAGLFFIARSILVLARDEGYRMPWWKFTLFLLVLIVLGFASFHLLAFLFPYLLGTVFLLGRFWWVPLVVVFLGSMGGGTAVYNSRGERIGTLD